MLRINFLTIKKIFRYAFKQLQQKNTNDAVKVQRRIAFIYVITAWNGFMYLLCQKKKNTLHSDAEERKIEIIHNAQKEGKDIQVTKTKGLSIKNNTAEDYPHINPSY